MIRTIVAIVVVMGFSSAFQPAAAQYPTAPVKVIVPYGPGGPADLFNRFLAQKLSQSLSQPFIVENRAGAGSVIGTDVAAKSAPDGYTLLAITNNQATNESLLSNRPYDLIRDFSPIASVMESDLVMVVHPSVAAKDLKDFIALVKGKRGQLNYASSGIGSGYHLAGELFKSMTGTDLVHVPYKNSSAARSDIISGQVQMMFDSTATIAQNVRAGQLRAFATTGKRRSAVLPDVPTASEAGLPGYEATIWLGLVAPTGTPKEVILNLNGEINKILNSEEARSTWAKAGATPLVMSAPEFDTFVKAEIKKWANIVRVSGAKL